jgi:hypothetical protein
MTSKMSTASAVVTATFDIKIVHGGTWAGDCTVDQVHKQALDGARGLINKMMASVPGVTLVGEVSVKMITHPIGDQTLHVKGF